MDLNLVHFTKISVPCLLYKCCHPKELSQRLFTWYVCWTPLGYLRIFHLLALVSHDYLSSNKDLAKKLNKESLSWQKHIICLVTWLKWKQLNASHQVQRSNPYAENHGSLIPYPTLSVGTWVVGFVLRDG